VSDHRWHSTGFANQDQCEVCDVVTAADGSYDGGSCPGPDTRVAALAAEAVVLERGAVGKAVEALDKAMRLFHEWQRDDAMPCLPEKPVSLVANALLALRGEGGER